MRNSCLILEWWSWCVKKNSVHIWKWEEPPGNIFSDFNSSLMPYKGNPFLSWPKNPHSVTSKQKIKQFRYAISPMQTNYKDQRWRFLPVSHIISYFLGINLRFQKSSATRSIRPNSVIYKSRLLNKLKKVRKIVDWEGPHQV